MGEEDARPRDEDEVEDISDTVAPSIGPHSTVVQQEHEVSPDASRVDAMGLDKRRSVVGGKYGVGAGRQAALYGGALAITAALVIGFILLAKQLDKSPDEFPDEAPWATVPSAADNHATNPAKIDLGH